MHSGKSVLERELTRYLARYATKALAEQGIELLLGRASGGGQPAQRGALQWRSASPRGTLISTVPSSPNPVVEKLGLPIVRGRLECEATMAVKGCEGVWAVGDCGMIPMRNGEHAPPTAQHAIRQAKVLAENIVADCTGARRRSFAFTGLGKLGALGHHKAVAELPGGIQVEGVLAWLMWRAIYWSKLPGASRKTRVAISWLSDLVLPAHTVQLNLGGGRGATQAHYEQGETVFEEGDTGDSLFMILSGQVEVLKRFEAEPNADPDAEPNADPDAEPDAAQHAEPQVVNTLGPGEYFGEMALLGRSPRSATTRALTPLDLLVLPGSDFSALAESLKEFRGEFEQIARARAESDQARAASSATPQ